MRHGIVGKTDLVDCMDPGINFETLSTQDIVGSLTKNFRWFSSRVISRMALRMQLFNVTSLSFIRSSSF